MSQIRLSDVQKLLHLDKPYPSLRGWEELLEFSVDGVDVTANVTHSWRSETIEIIKPFEVNGGDYGVGFEPPLFVLECSVSARDDSFAEAGLTYQDHWLQVAKQLYRFHVIYLKHKSAIDLEQHQYLDKFSDQLEFLRYRLTITNEQLRICRSTLKMRLREVGFSKTDYQSILIDFRTKAESTKREFHALQNQVDRELHEIKLNFIKKEMSEL